MAENAAKSAVNQVGDGKLPNKYWVTISEDYDVLTAPGELNAASESGLIKNPKYKTIRVFTSYTGAKQFIDDNLFLGGDFDGITVNTVTIEDRLSGEIFRHAKSVNPKTLRVWDDAYEDVGFTEKKLGKNIRSGGGGGRKSRHARGASSPGSSLSSMR